MAILLQGGVCKNCLTLILSWQPKTSVVKARRPMGTGFGLGTLCLLLGCGCRCGGGFSQSQNSKDLGQVPA